MKRNIIREMTTPENLAKYNFTDEQKEQIASLIELNDYLELFSKKFADAVERKKNEKQ